MRKWLLFLSICLSCATKEESQEQPIAYEAPEHEEWIVYEGLVRSDAGNDIKVELSLLQNATGMESVYKTVEEYISRGDDRLLTRRKGKYSILYGSGSDMLISLNESAGSSLGLQSSADYSISINPKLPTEKVLASARVGKLTFKTGVNSNELVLLDENSNPVSADDRYTLKKRSILFTIEGFVTVLPSASEFFEFNTRENWIVLRSGCYDEVASNYLKFAREKNEGIYLKAIAFYVEDIDSAGSKVKNLVIKRILTMKPHEEFVRSTTTD